MQNCGAQLRRKAAKALKTSEDCVREHRRTELELRIKGSCLWSIDVGGGHDR